MSAVTASSPHQLAGPDREALDAIQQHILWLATRMIDAANHDRPNGDGVKIGGHQASCASLVSTMTALYFHHLGPDDYVSVKPHASPVLHAINYIKGGLDRSYLTRLRDFGGLQSYPSRTKDPDRVDFSTGSVGLGAAAPLFAAAVRRYVDDHFGPRTPSRFVSLLGDAELDEGNVWEAVNDVALQGLGNVMWVVDFNRQSLDRVIPGVRIAHWTQQFEAAGWHVTTLKYGRRLRDAFDRPGGDAMRSWVDSMPNDQYQASLVATAETVRQTFLDGAPEATSLFCAQFDDAELRALIGDLGGHDLADLLDAFAECDREASRPSVVFAYTLKGWRLPLEGQPRNHSQLLSTAQVSAFRTACGLTEQTEWDRLPEDSPGWRLLAPAQPHRKKQPALAVRVPTRSGLNWGADVSTQEAFGRVLGALARDEQLAPYLVTTAPDVATSTNLAGYINRAGVFSPADRRSWFQDPMLRWAEQVRGHHIELGISEMNLFLMLEQLGLAWDLSDQALIPVGTVYDPFVLRGLDAFIHAVYSDSRFIVAGTPSGITLAPEGGAHQSTITPSVGVGLPGVTLIEPAFAAETDWLLLDAMQRIASGASGAYYLRLSTRPIGQAPLVPARERLGDAVLQRQAIAGAYRLVDASRDAQRPAVVQIAATGAVMPEALAAAAELADEGVPADVVNVTSQSRLYDAWTTATRAAIRTASGVAVPGAIADVLRRGLPLVTVHDATAHAMAWLGAALAAPTVSLGVNSFGQSGSVSELYQEHDLSAGAIVNAALTALSSAGRL